MILLSHGGWVLITVDYGGGGVKMPKNDYVICERHLRLSRFILQVSGTSNISGWTMDMLPESYSYTYN